MNHLQDACDRAREELSLALDGELAELDRARLDAHLASCTSCRELHNELASMTSTLRDTPLDPATFSVSMPKRRRISVRALQASAAAAAVAIVGGLASAGSVPIQMASGPSFQLGLHVVDRGDELVPGTVHLRVMPERTGDRVAV